MKMEAETYFILYKSVAVVGAWSCPDVGDKGSAPSNATLPVRARPQQQHSYNSTL